MSSVNEFRPIFIVGHARSGTTLLATLLDRNSNISMPPETQFFRGVLSNDNHRKVYSHKYLMKRYLECSRTNDLNLNKEDIWRIFKDYPADYSHLLRAALEAYTKKEGKKRSGEKSPSHLGFVPLILKWYPDARIICIVRDGRAVVSSVMKVNWHHKHLHLHCAEWNYYSRLAVEYQKKYSHSLEIVKYEDLIASPETVLRRLSLFVGEDYEPAQLVPKESKVVPAWEKSWKDGATGKINPGRIDAWKESVSTEDRYLMEVIMHKWLMYWGYQADSLDARLSKSSIIKILLYSEPSYCMWRPLHQFALKLKVRFGAVKSV